MFMKGKYGRKYIEIRISPQNFEIQRFMKAYVG